MTIDTQWLWIEKNSSPSSPTGAKSEWFLVVPARFGGGEITVTLPSAAEPSSKGPRLELKSESQGRIRATRVDLEDGRARWSWPAPDDSQLCRLFVKTAGDVEDVDVHVPLKLEQHVDDASGERIVLGVAGAQYESKLIRIIGGKPETDLVRVDEDVEYRPSNATDVLVTRYLPLAPGSYRLRLRFPRRGDETQLIVRPQLRDSSWLPASTSIESHESGEIISSFEVGEPGRDVRLTFTATGPVRLPDVQLACISDAQTTAVASDTADSSRADRAIERSIRELASRADERRLAAVLASVTEDAVRRALPDDPWLLNYAMNAWEFVHQRTVLTTYPPDICVPIADVCNARCTFCTSWLEGTKIATLEQIEGFEALFRRARWVGLAGHGEPLAHPQIKEILARLASWLDRRAVVYVITNGVYLESLFDELMESRVKSFHVSLNAASAATHREVMGLPTGSFEKILTSIRRLAQQGESNRSRVCISMVITRQNLAEVPAFVALGHDLGVDKIQLKTLASSGGQIEGLNYHTLPPYEHPDYDALKARAVAAITASDVSVQVDTDSWDVPVFPPAFQEQLRRAPARFVTRDEALSSRSLRQMYHALPKYQAKSGGRLMDEVLDFDGVNPLGRVPPFACRAPYRHLYINDFSFNMSPCCYLSKVPGAEPVMYDGGGSFMDAWNSEALVALRTRLRDGPLFNMCTKCPGTY